jgi:hypothetical protein
VIVIAIVNVDGVAVRFLPVSRCVVTTNWSAFWKARVVRDHDGHCIHFHTLEVV